MVSAYPLNLYSDEHSLIFDSTTGDQLDALLEALDLNKDGELEARRQRFAIFIGLSADFVYHCCDCLDSLMCRS